MSYLGIINFANKRNKKMLDEPTGLENPVYYSVNFENRKQFGISNAMVNSFYTEDLFKESKLITFPTAININIYETKELWLSAQK